MQTGSLRPHLHGPCLDAIAAHVLALVSALDRLLAAD